MVRKFFALVFALLILASFVFMGFRIAAKPAYSEHELKKCQVMAVSAVDIIAQKLEDSPLFLTKFGSSKIILTADHKKMPDNLVVKLEITDYGKYASVSSKVNSGWNSRSPKEYICTAKIYNDNGKNRIVYDAVECENIAVSIIQTDFNEKKNTIEFVLPDENKKMPEAMSALVVWSVKENLAALKYNKHN